MASERVPFANPVKFGDDLELDPGAYELRRAGRPLKLKRIPMELLLLLVEQHGQLVTREHIIERICCYADLWLLSSLMRLAGWGLRNPAIVSKSCIGRNRA
jgi:hypothetical protein